MNSKSILIVCMFLLILILNYGCIGPEPEFYIPRYNIFDLRQVTCDETLVETETETETETEICDLEELKSFDIEDEVCLAWVDSARDTDDSIEIVVYKEESDLVLSIADPAPRRKTANACRYKSLGSFSEYGTGFYGIYFQTSSRTVRRTFIEIN